MKKLICLFLFLYSNSFCQEVDLDAFIQRIAATQQEDEDYEALYELFYQLYQNPIDINNCNRDDLRNLFFLSENQINNIIERRDLTGDYQDILELQGVQGISPEDYQNIIPFLRVLPKLTSKNFFKNPTQNYLVIKSGYTIEPSKGFTDKKYVGGRLAYYTRYRIDKAGVYSFGFISEKDPGEKSFFDYSIFHAQIMAKGFFRNITIGNFSAQTGQGLVLGAVYSPGKGAESIYTTRKSHLGLKTYNSIVENGGFRGLGSTFQLGLMEVSLFASSRKKDANINEDQEVTSILYSGYHRTASEIEDHNKLTESNIGSIIHFKINQIRLGFSMLSTVFNHPIKKRDLLYNRFDFSGKKNIVGGLNFSYGWQNFNFFGEFAKSKSGGNALIVGLIGSLGPKLEIAFNIRNYDRDFHSFYSNALAESSRTFNEKGIYTGIKYKFSKEWQLNLFYDRFQFPWLRYQVNSPSGGFDYMTRLSYVPKKTLDFYIQYHQEWKQKSIPDLNYSLQYVKRTNSLINMNYQVIRGLKLQSRLQMNAYGVPSLSKSIGWALMQDVEGDFKKFKYRFRLAYFKTQDYNSRIYAYENDVLYSVSFPAYFGSGWRSYMVGTYNFSKVMSIAIRFAYLLKPNEESLSSGNNQINGNHKTDLKLQLKFSFL